MQVGEQVLNYKITAKLGEGGMGSVYVGSHIQLGRKAAIKALHPNLVNNPMIRERFKNEAATMAHLRHPNIVGLYDYLETTNGLYLIMEYVQGKPLDDYINQISGPIPENIASQLFVQILDGFDYAHNQGVVHRDIKPSNLIINPEGEVKILDFGIAKLLDGSSKSLTQAGSRMGTILYMSPEQVKGQEVDRRSDIYSLGLTLFQMLTGKTVYDEHNATEYEIYNQIVNNPLPRAQSIYPKVSGRMQAIIDQATAKMPYERFQSCAEFKRTLLGENYLSKTMPNPLLNTVMGKTPPVAQDSLAKSSDKNEVIASQSIDYTPRPSTRLRVYSWLNFLFLILLLGGGIGFVLFNPLDLPQLRDFALLKNTPLVSQEPRVRARVKEFYKAIETHQFENLKPFYRDTLAQYYSFKNSRLVPDIKSSCEIYWKTYIFERHEIDWDTFEYQTDEAGNYVVRFSMKYYFQMVGKNEDYLTTKAEIKFDADLKIFSIVQIK
jgi:serine/threonine protein kinase